MNTPDAFTVEESRRRYIALGAKPARGVGYSKNNGQCIVLSFGPFVASDQWHAQPERVAKDLGVPKTYVIGVEFGWENWPLSSLNFLLEGDLDFMAGVAQGKILWEALEDLRK